MHFNIYSIEMAYLVLIKLDASEIYPRNILADESQIILGNEI